MTVCEVRGSGVLLAKVLEGVCCAVTAQTEGFVALRGAELVDVVGIETMMHGELDAGRPIAVVEGFPQAHHIGGKAVAIGHIIGDRCMAVSMQDVVVVMSPLLEGSILARNRGKGGG